MTYYERQSCIGTINLLRNLALNIHGVIDVVDNANCDKLIELLNGGIDEIYQAREAAHDARLAEQGLDGTVGRRDGSRMARGRTTATLRRSRLDGCNATALANQ